MKNTLALFAVLLLVLSGCLEIDAQDVTFRYDEAADRIDAHFVHRGLFVEQESGGGKDPMAKALADLAKVQQTGKVVFWCNWPFTFDLTAEANAPAKALLAHIDVENGGLFTDPNGVLCGHQFVRVREAKAFIAKLNSLFELWAQAQLLGGTTGRGGAHQYDDDTKDLVREFLRSGEKMIVVHAGRIEVRLPLSAPDHAWFKGQFERLFLDNMPREMVRRVGVAERRAAGGDVADTSVRNESVQFGGETLKEAMQKAPSYRFFWDNEWTITRTPELTTLGLGAIGADELRVIKSSEGLYHDGLLKALREKGEQIEDGVPDQELTRRFTTFRARDAVLPEKVAALRAGKAAPADARQPPK